MNTQFLVMNLKSRLKELAAKSEEKRSGVGRAALIGAGVTACRGDGWGRGWRRRCGLADTTQGTPKITL
jgi:hypothetical protein